MGMLHEPPTTALLALPRVRGEGERLLASCLALPLPPPLPPPLLLLLLLEAAPPPLPPLAGVLGGGGTASPPLPLALLPLALLPLALALLLGSGRPLQSTAASLTK